MRYELKIAYNFLAKSKGQTLFLLTAIATGIAVQLYISALIVSLQDNIIETTLGSIPHITIEDGNSRDSLKKELNSIYINGNYSLERDRISNYENIIKTLEKNKDIKYIVPTIEGNALYERQGKNLSLLIRGMDLNRGDNIFKIKDKIYLGEKNIDSNKILIGKRISEDFFLSPMDIMYITASNENKESFRVNGIFDLENQSGNNGIIYMDFQKTQNFFKKNGYINRIHLQLNDIFLADKVSENISKIYPNLKITSWMKDGEQLLGALRGQSASSLVIQVVIILSTTLSITSLLYVTVIQKTKEIGILKAMGAKDISIGIIFMIQGVLFGVIGAILGIIFGYILIWVFKIFAKPDFEIVVNLNTLLRTFLFALCSGLIGAYIPSRKSTKLDPIEVIKGD